METESFRRVHPDNILGISGIFLENPEPGFLLFIIYHRGPAFDHFLKLKHHLLVGNYDVVFGDREIVHHGGHVEGDFHGRGQVPGRGNVEAAGVEEEEPSYPRVAVELAYSFGENRPVQFFFLNQPLRLREPARVAHGIAVNCDGVNHAVPVEEVVPGYRLEEGVSAVSYVNAVNAVRDGPLDREVMPNRLLRDRGEVPRYLDPRISRFR
nr:hypothetical protein MtrunA17_Chr2g0312961 [Ipomoea batatas]